MRDLIIGLSILHLTGGFNFDGETSCYADNANPNLGFGAKTSYQFIANMNTDEIRLPGCKPVQVWMFARHGARMPRNDFEPESGVPETELQLLNMHLPSLRDRVVLNHAIGRGLLCDADVENIKNWTLRVDFSVAEDLSPGGKDEMYGIGERLKARLPGLMNETYEDGSYAFRFTTSIRAEDSCRYFAKGVWGEEEAKISYPLAMHNDPVTRFYKACNRYNKEVENSTSTSRDELREFEKGPEMTRVVQQVSRRLGFTTQLSNQLVTLIYTMCRYDKALFYGEVSPWCAAFSEADLSVLEYIDDLIYYYKEAYGFEINWLQACNPVVDVFNYFNSVVNGTSKKPYGIFNFSHSSAMGKLLARWGLFKDATPPTASNFAINSRRQWRTSRMLPFALNMVFVLFECESNNYKVQLYVNEKLEKIPGCAEATCTYPEFVDYVKPIVNTCDLDAICENFFR